MKFLISSAILVITVHGAVCQYRIDSTPRSKKTKQESNISYHQKSIIHSPNTANLPYLSLHFISGLAPYKNSEFSPKAEFAYNVDNQQFQYSDSMHRSKNYNNTAYWGFGLEFGMSNGLFGGFALRLADYHRYSLIGGINIELGYNFPIIERVSLRPSLSVCWMETDYVFHATRAVGNDLYAFGNSYTPVFSTHNPQTDGDITLINTSFGLIPKIELNYDIPVQRQFIISLKIGAGLMNQSSHPFKLDLNATPRVNLTTPGLKFSDGNIPSESILHYNGVIWNLTISFTALLKAVTPEQN